MGSGRPLETHQRRATGHTAFAKTRCSGGKLICSLWKVPPAVRLLNGPGARADVSSHTFQRIREDPTQDLGQILSRGVECRGFLMHSRSARGRRAAKTARGAIGNSMAIVMGDRTHRTFRDLW